MTDRIRPASHVVLRTIIRRVILTYQLAVYASFGFVLAGFLVALFTDHPVSTEMGSPLELSRRMAELHPAGFFGVGIGIMILAPIIMLADVASTFLRFGDRRYALITATVTLILAFSILLSFLIG